VQKEYKFKILDYDERLRRIELSKEISGKMAH
jgi:hypothetical protein